ncbi:DUF2971 domain-containing protein [Thalassospira sp. A40-3]|uniref:DUF2971 domain-containing protein n=1 Tax=Thalassospira sp. A40-3 TaxID=2785908 RepID=UPI0018CCA590|nr:DUF2971 domain-containing protein [Thalassospira sp. A40-3]QPO12038.1 DUF2971 domain-containing protein [Thalassospira sp. A40-3]
MRVYKYYPANWAWEAIIHKRLKLTTLSDINDPFEFRAIGTSDRTLRRNLEDWRNDLPKQLGFVSFCRNRKNPVIWSHYAEKYTGICLGFEVPDEFLLEINYVNERQVMTREQLLSAHTQWKDKGESPLLTTKFSHWEYEAEKRVFYRLKDEEVIKENGLHFAPFEGMFSLQEIILGPKYLPPICELKKTELRKAQSSLKKCPVKTGRLAFNTFEIVLQSDKNRQKSLI